MQIYLSNKALRSVCLLWPFLISPDEKAKGNSEKGETAPISIKKQ